MTHHVLVCYAAISVGKFNFSDCCIFGDDVVIADDQVAEAYLSLMSILGVSINMTKSVISSEFAEFAKRLKGPGVEYTPIGSGVIT